MVLYIFKVHSPAQLCVICKLGNITFNFIIQIIIMLIAGVLAPILVVPTSHCLPLVKRKPYNIMGQFCTLISLIVNFLNV